MIATPVERFFAYVSPEPNTGCWLWAAGAVRQGYGRLKVNGKTVRAHRFSYEIHKGQIPIGLDVLHSCDTPECVNPDHLSVGTTQDNANDMVARGRQCSGERQHLAKMTAADVIEIRRLRSEGARYDAIGKAFGIRPENASFIARRVTWKHVA